MPIQIHGNSYTTVPERVREWHEDHKDGEPIFVETKCQIMGDFVVCEASVKTKRGTFTGTSAVNPKEARQIEKDNPFEVAETSAVGRALGFAGYGAADSIASADEMVKAGAHVATSEILAKAQERRAVDARNRQPNAKCATCGADAEERVGVSKSGKSWHGIFCFEDRTHVQWLPTQKEPNGEPSVDVSDTAAPEPDQVPF